MPFAFCLAVQAGTLRTLDGKTYEGVLRLDERGVSVVPATGPTPPVVPLGDVLYADFRSPAPALPPRARTSPAPAPAANGQLPAPWRGGAVGTLAQPPYAKFHDGKFSLKSAAATVGGTRDAFAFASQPVGEDADLVACLEDTANGQVVAGLTVRAGSATATDAAHLSLLYFGDDIRFMRRVHAGRASEGGPVGGHVNLPIWMRLTRRGMYVTTFLSKDGQSWEEVGKATFTPAEGVDVFAGLAVFGTTEQLAGAHFTNVRLTASAPKDRTDAAVPAAAASGASAGAAPPPAAPLKRGLLLRSGTLLANADVYRADDGSVRYTKDGRGETISMVNVARVLFRDLTPREAAKIPANGSGVLLKEGDFVEGEFKSLREGQVTLSSVVFGLTKFDVRTKVAALVINDPDPQRAEAIVRTTDGSTYSAKRVAIDKNRVTIEDPVAGPLTVAQAEVTELSIGPGRTEPLAGVRPETVEPSPDALSVNPAGATVGGVTGERAVAMTAGSSATWALDGKYRALTLSCGVPAGVLPTTPVRFVVVADGKELFRTPPRTSLADPLAASLNVAGVKTLTLRVESTCPDPLPTPGVWVDPSLVK